MFRIDVPRDGVDVTVRSAGDTDTTARLLDGAMAEVAMDDGGDGNFQIEATLDAGIYYVEVGGHEAGPLPRAGLGLGPGLRLRRAGHDGDGPRRHRRDLDADVHRPAADRRGRRRRRPGRVPHRPRRQRHGGVRDGGPHRHHGHAAGRRRHGAGDGGHGRPGDELQHLPGAGAGAVLPGGVGGGGEATR